MDPNPLLTALRSYAASVGGQLSHEQFNGFLESVLTDPGNHDPDLRIYGDMIRIAEFPIRFHSEEWTSGGERGSLAWLLDVIPPSQKFASAVLANFRQVVKEGDMRIHPIVARMVDPELLKKMGASTGAEKVG